MSELGTPSPSRRLHGGFHSLINYTSDQIVAVSNWGDYYEVGGVRLSAMRMLNDLIITWPDGETTGGALRLIDRGYESVHDGLIGREVILLASKFHGLEFTTMWKPGDPTTFRWAEER